MAYRDAAGFVPEKHDAPIHEPMTKARATHVFSNVREMLMSVQIFEGRISDMKQQINQMHDELKKTCDSRDECKARLRELLEEVGEAAEYLRSNP